MAVANGVDGSSSVHMVRFGSASASVSLRYAVEIRPHKSMKRAAAAHLCSNAPNDCHYGASRNSEPFIALPVLSRRTAGTRSDVV